jgi:hypothetical protein
VFSSIVPPEDKSVLCVSAFAELHRAFLSKAKLDLFDVRKVHLPQQFQESTESERKRGGEGRKSRERV